MNEEILGFLSNVLNTTREEVEQIVADKALLEEKYKGVTDTIFNEGVKKGTVNAQKTVNTLATQLTGKPVNVSSFELAIKEIEQFKVAQAQSPTQLTESDIKSHPFFIEYETKVGESRREYDTRISKLEADLNEAAQIGEIKALSMSELAKIKVKPYGNPNMDKIAKEQFLKELESVRMNNGEIWVNGERYVDSYKRPQGIDVLVKDLASKFFVIEEGTPPALPNTGSANGNPHESPNQDDKLQPKTIEEFNKIYADPNVSDEDKRKAAIYYSKRK